MTAAGAIILVPEVRDDAHVAEAVSAGGQERVLDDLHADWAEEVLIELRAGGGRGDGEDRCVRSGGGGGGAGGLCSCSR